MRVALIYPPSCDPTAPYISVPMLTGFLRENGVETIPIDANVEAYDLLLKTEPLKRFAELVEKRLRRLERKRSLDHEDQLHFCRLRDLDDILSWVPDEIEDAVSVLRDRSGKRFFDPYEYDRAVFVVEAALKIASAAHYPLEMDFTAYRTPFSLLSTERIEEDARAEFNPFQPYFSNDLCQRLSSMHVDIAGISMAFPGQVQPGYSLALEIARKMPETHLTAGGPALTQMFAKLDREKIPGLLGPFHSAVLCEGERALLSLVRTVESGKKPPSVVYGESGSDMSELPAPDFDGLPLEKYFSPELVLPYDPTRGCYWGKCAFCQYGLSDKGTARYRRRPVHRITNHLKTLKSKCNCRVFYFSQDAFDPVTARRVSRALKKEKIAIKWASDMRPEKTLDPECCRVLADGGALAVSLGIESAAPRVLDLIEKGVSLADMRAAVENLSDAGIAAEAMCFTDFPTETAKEALLTLDFVERMREHIALFICGRFGLCAGSRVARFPEQYGIRSTWTLKGDEFESGLFYEEKSIPKTDSQQESIDRRIDALSEKWRLRDYPWAGALSTAHTLLYYDRYGPDVFKPLASKKTRWFPPREKALPPSRFDVAKIMEAAFENEALVWQELIFEKREVGPGPYRRLARALPRRSAPAKKFKKPVEYLRTGKHDRNRIVRSNSNFDKEIMPKRSRPRR